MSDFDKDKKDALDKLNIKTIKADSQRGKALTEANRKKAIEEAKKKNEG